jgi:4-hydroxybenzoate polyprenyltransferase
MPTTSSRAAMSRSTLLAIVMIVSLALIGSVALFSLKVFYALVIALSVVLATVYAVVRKRLGGPGKNARVWQ